MSVPPEPSWIVCLGDDWGYQTTSTQQLMRELARHHPLLWINSVGMRVPSLSVRDLRRLWTKGFATPGLQKQDDVHIANLRVLPYHHWRWARAVNQGLVRIAVARWMRTLTIVDPIVVCAVPTAVDVVRTFPARQRVYYCIDDWQTMPGCDWHMIEPFERELLSCADVVVVTSEALRDLPRFHGPRTRVLPHGVEYERFAVAAAGPAPALHAWAANLPRPILGFAGLIDERIDVALLERLAEEDLGTLLIVGESLTNLGTLPRRANVRLVGYVPFADVPAYLSLCDVLLAPYSQGEATRALQPLKVREYLATGKQVVAIEIPALTPLHDLVSLAHSHEEFVTATRHAIVQGTNGSTTRMSFAEQESWRNRAREFETLLDL